jgi:thymidylate synthase (FAD)
MLPLSTPRVSSLAWASTGTIDPKLNGGRVMNDVRRKQPTSAKAPETKLSRCVVTALDEMLGLRLPVLDDGFIRVIDYMGDDKAIVQATKVSSGAGSKKAGDDRVVIRNLMRRWHTTPFEMCEIKLHVRTPMDVWRQWIRHRTANVNEHSTQHSIANSALATPAEAWRAQSSESKPSTEAFLPLETGQLLSGREAELQRMSREVYEQRFAAGVEGEQARKDLPLSTYTEAYWKIDLHNLLHFLHLRMNNQAQREIRAYAEVIGTEIVAKWVPLAWEAFLDYRRNAVLMSRIEAEVAGALIANAPERAKQIVESAGLLAFDKSGKPSRSRERTELETKLKSLGLTPPWL